MDLRSAIQTAKQRLTAERVLNYQPFLIADDLQTGVGYSWLHSTEPRVSPPLVFKRDEWAEQWGRITSANRALAQMYDDFVDEIAKHYPGGSLLDFACNNGYFPVRAELNGMHNCAGIDLGAHYADSVSFLNATVGTAVKFYHAPYEQTTSSTHINEKFDVVCLSAIMCHMPEPLRLLAAIGKIAREAIFFWGQMLDTEKFLISYNPPHASLSTETVFPFRFNDNTRISRGLFREAAEQMGFTKVSFLKPREHWLLTGTPATDLEREITTGSAHVAVLAMRG